MAQLRYTLLLCVCAAGLLLPAALADDASAAVEAAAARGEAVVLAAPGGGEVAAAAAGAAAEPINEGGFAAFSVGAIVRAADLAALARGNVSRVPFVAASAFQATWAATYTNDGTNKTKGSIAIDGVQYANFDSINPASTYEDPSARLLGLGGAGSSSANVLQPGAAVTYVGRQGIFNGVAERGDITRAALGVPPVQPVVFPADNTACQYLINTVDADCGVFFDGRARSDITFNSALPPPLDKPLLSGGPLADYVLGPTNAAKLSCVLDDPSKFVTVGSDCAKIFPFPAPAAVTEEGASTATTNSVNDKVNKLLLGAAKGARPTPPKDAREQWQQQLERLPARLDDTVGAAPEFFFGGGGGGGGGSLPPNVNVTNTWSGSIGVSLKVDDLRALLNGSASSAATIGFPLASIFAKFTLADEDGTTPRSVAASASVDANIPGASEGSLKAKIFGAGGGLPLIGGGNPLKPSKVVSYAGLVTPFLGRIKESDGAFLEKIPVAFTPGDFCSYRLLGVNDAGKRACRVEFYGVTPSAPTFPSLLANGVGDLPLVSTAFSNFALRPTSLVSFSCELTDPSTPTVIDCDA